MVTKIEIILDLITQEIPREIGIWLGTFFITGMVSGLAAACIVGGLWSRDKRRIEKEAEEAGVILEIESSSGFDAYEIEGCGYCIGFIIIIAVSAMGITLPIVLPEAAEDIIMVTVMIIFGAALWALALWSVPYVKTYRRGFREKLQKAIESKSGSDG
jgi:hypothetical protein